jgi:hypothetical protein
MPNDGKKLETQNPSGLSRGYHSPQLNLQNLSELALRELGLGLGYWYLRG